MSETSGTVVISNSSIFRGIDVDKVLSNSQYFIRELFEAGNVKTKLVEADYVIESLDQKGSYLELSIFGDEWEILVESVVKAVSDLEMYASLYSEYGTRMYFGKRSNGDTYQYSYEDDGGDEVEQDYFDIGVFKKQLKSHEGKWLELLPPEIKEKSPNILPVNPSFIDVSGGIDEIKSGCMGCYVSNKEFLGDVKGAEISGDLDELSAEAIIHIRNNDISSFRLVLDRIKKFIYGSLSLDAIVEFIVYQNEIGLTIGEAQNFAEELVSNFPKYYLKKSLFTSFVEESIAPRDECPYGSVFPEALLNAHSEKPIYKSLSNAISSAARNDQVDLLSRLLKIEEENIYEDKSKVKKSKFKRTVMAAAYGAAWNDNIESLRILLPLTSKKKSADLFEAAAEAGSTEILKLLVETGVNINPQKDTLFYKVVCCWDFEVIGALFEYGLQVPEDGTVLDDCMQKLVSQYTTKKNELIESKEIFELIRKNRPGFLELIEDKEKIVEKSFYKGRNAWSMIFGKEEKTKSLGVGHFRMIIEVLDLFISENIERNPQIFNTFIFEACIRTMPVSFQKLKDAGADVNALHNGSSLIEIANEEADIYFFGRRKDLNTIHKVNALRILDLLGEDLSRFPLDLVEYTRKLYKKYD